MPKYPIVVLCVLDGWGCRAEQFGNAIATAKTPFWHSLFERYPWTMLEASGEAVGLPKGIMGNSEVGHMNLGSGRVVPQGVVIIDEAIRTGKLPNNETLQRVINHVREHKSTLHLMGLLSDGQVHSSIAHLFALIEVAADAGIPVAIHAFLDGRDTPPRSAETYVEQLERQLAEKRETHPGWDGCIATVTGRFYAMDRDSRVERTQQAYDALAYGKAAFHTTSALDAVQAGYARGEDDEFIQPTIVGDALPVRDGDALVFFNFRPDRARQLTNAFNHSGLQNFLFATMTRYDETYDNPVLFGPRPQFYTFGEIVAKAGLHQLRLAETEKYAHVTYFFNGGREDVFENEDRKLIPSDRSVITYDLAPQMRANEITDAAVEAIRSGKYQVIVMNYANADMVGHTGKWEPTIESVQVLDACMERLTKAVLDAKGLLAITADHGNAEEKIDPNGNPLTAHTTNPVPLIFVADNLAPARLAKDGKLGDVAPTLLRLMELNKPTSMSGNELL